MATNGQDHNEALASVERAITGSRLAMMPTKTTEPADSITSFNQELAERYRALARHAKEHGDYISQLLNEHADKILSDHRRVTGIVLAAERKLLEDAQRFVGNAE